MGVAVSIDVEDSTLVLHASQNLQERFELLLEKRKAGTLSPEEQREYAAIGDLDTALSWLNRLIRGARPRGGSHDRVLGHAADCARAGAAPL